MTPKDEYLNMKRHAADRDIDFNLSYEEYLELWLTSGKWGQRGRNKGNYQMTRPHDIGAYSKNNIVIKTVEENQEERHHIPVGETQSIIIDWCTGLFTQRELAKRYKLHQSTISKIVNKKRRASYAAR